MTRLTLALANSEIRYLLLPSRDVTEILLKRRNFSKQPKLQPSSPGNMEF